MIAYAHPGNLTVLRIGEFHRVRRIAFEGRLLIRQDCRLHLTRRHSRLYGDSIPRLRRYDPRNAMLFPIAPVRRIPLRNLLCGHYDDPHDFLRPRLERDQDPVGDLHIRGFDGLGALKIAGTWRDLLSNRVGCQLAYNRIAFVRSNLQTKLSRAKSRDRTDERFWRLPLCAHCDCEQQNVDDLLHLLQ